MRIERLEESDAARVATAVGIWQAAHEADHPRDPAFAPSLKRGRILHPMPDEPTQRWLALEGGRAVGVVAVMLPELDNTGSAWTELAVHPAARGRGVGRALWAHVAEVCRAAGRKLVLFESPMEGPGAAFARSVDAKLGILSARRQLVVEPGIRALAAELADTARLHAGGYEVRSYRGPTPAEWAEGLAYLTGRMSTDAPLDDLEWEPENYDVDRLLGREAAAFAQGVRRYETVAVHSATGTVVGFSTIGMAADDPTAGSQWNTIVDPEHRGHRLGTLIKVVNLRYTLGHESGLRRIMTWNAVSNAHMIAVNEAMGFRFWDHWGEWQVRF